MRETVPHHGADDTVSVLREDQVPLAVHSTVEVGELGTMLVL